MNLSAQPYVNTQTIASTASKIKLLICKQADQDYICSIMRSKQG